LIKIFKKKLQELFKKIFYSIFILRYGSIKGVLNKNITIEKTTLEGNIDYKIFLIKNCRLYTDTINDTAFIKNNLIVEGPSFQFRNNKNAKSEDNIIFQKGTPRIMKKIRGRVLSLLTGGGGNSNYWHWLFDVLPRIFIFSNHSDLNKIDYFLFPDLKENFQIESLKILNMPMEKCLSSRYYRHFIADELVATEHPYNFLNDPLKDSLSIPHWISSHLKKKFNLIKNETNKSFPEKFYIDRSDSKSMHAKMRIISNENEVIEVLKKYNFSALRLSDYHFNDQIQLFNQAKCVVGLHGAGFANIIFSKPNTKIVELRSSTAGEIIENLAKNHNLNYHCISVDPKISFNNQLGEIKINIDALKSIIE
jgi:capsular polysaccharide biosynthesis protein